MTFFEYIHGWVQSRDVCLFHMLPAGHASLFDGLVSFSWVRSWDSFIWGSIVRS